jgi:hypothetical protein
MQPDPRTLDPILKVARCHLVPEWASVSSCTLPLDEETDNKIGAYCDSELQRFLEVYFGTTVRGKAAMVGGAKSLSAVLDTRAASMVVPVPRRSCPGEFAERALGSSDGNVRLEGFTSLVADGLAADVSVIHSAFLILHYHGRKEIFGQEFAQVRHLFRAAITQSLSPEDDEYVRSRVSYNFAYQPPAQLTGPVMPSDYRNLYNRTCDFGDGVFAEFPHRSVVQEGSVVKVIVPYSASLRGVVRFGD